MKPRQPIIMYTPFMPPTMSMLVAIAVRHYEFVAAGSMPDVHS